MNIRLFKILFSFLAGFMFLLIAFNNITDYWTNFDLVKMVVGMDSVSAESVQWRAIKSPPLQHALYLAIIVWESLTAIFCLIGSLSMLNANRSIQSYATGKKMAFTGLTMGFALFMGGFVVIAGEWFYLWASPLASMHAKAILFSLLLASFAYFVSRNDEARPDRG